MKAFTRYLYEYRNGKRVRNAGFVKIEQADRHALIKIYGNGIGAAGEFAEVFLCELQGENCFGIPAGNMKAERAGIRGVLEYTASDVGGEEVFGRIGGIVLKCRGNAGHSTFYAAMWEDVPVAVEEMKIKEQNETTEEDVVRESDLPEKTIDEEVGKEEDSPEEKTTPEKTEPEGSVEEAENTIYKITRKDMAALPKREWCLANNPFLLHGYHQYHHLVSFRQEDVSWLGVPGIYHPMEQRAADTYGFGQFMSPGEGEIVWEKDERAEDENFGYWCRQVSRVITKTEADRR